MLVLYLHGFLSSPSSFKAQETGRWLQQHRPEIEFLCPQLSAIPSECESYLNSLVAEQDPESLCLIGSSLGGFWASYLIERKLAKRAVLVNPAVSPASRFTELVGQELKYYYSDDTVCLSREALFHLEKCESEEVRALDRYWVMLQTGDETLDYRLAEQRYKGCRVLIEEGGNHTFDGYEKWLPKIIDFFEE